MSLVGKFFLILWVGYLLSFSKATDIFTDTIHATFHDGANASVTDEECYLIGLKEASDANIEALKVYLIAHDKVDLKTFYESFNIFHICATFMDIENLLTVPFVKYVEREKMVDHMADNPGAPKVQQNTINWGLDYVDGKVDNAYSYTRTGKGVTIYILDGGANVNHVEFIDPVTKKSRLTVDQTYLGQGDANDIHGSHVSGIAAGLNIGPARDSNIVMIKVLNNGSGAVNTVISALHDLLVKLKGNPAPAVINMSLGGALSQTFNDAVNQVVDAGIPVVVAAGNSARDASLSSPSSATGAIGVGALGKDGQLTSFSNFGPTVIISAPGADIQSVNYLTTDGYITMSGTSMAAPLVAGIVALMLEENPQATPAQIKALLKSNAATGDLQHNTPGFILKSPYVQTTTTQPPTNDNTAAQPPKNDTSGTQPPKNDTAQPPKNDTATPPKNDTAPPPKNDTAPPPKNDETPANPPKPPKPQKPKVDCELLNAFENSRTPSCPNAVHFQTVLRALQFYGLQK